MELPRLVERRLRRSLSAREEHLVGWYAPEPPSGSTTEEQADELAEFFKAAENGASRGGRSSAKRANVGAPDWWPFYVERVARGDLGEMARSFRAQLGLTEPLPEEAATGFVRDVIAEAGTPKVGACADLSVPSAGGHESFTVYGIPENSGAWSVREWQIFLLRDQLPRRYRALATLAYIAQTEGLHWTSRNATWSATEIVAFVLCDVVPTRPWMRYSFRSTGRLCPEITLSIPTAAISPEQVRALYEQARQTLATFGPQTLPKALTKERIQLVRFVEENSGSDPPNWKRLLEEWNAQGGDYSTPAAMKAAFYQSANPVRAVSAAAAEAATSGSSNLANEEA